MSLKSKHQLHDVLNAFLDEIQQIVQHKKNDQQQFQQALKKVIRRHKIGTIVLSESYGGYGINKETLFQFIIQLAAIDSDVAHILRTHFINTEPLIRKHTNVHHESLLHRIADGALLGSATTENSNKTIGKHQYETSIQREGNDFRLDGVKYFTTGALYADLLYVVAANEAGQVVRVLVPADRLGITFLDDWDGIGQQQTSSGTTLFENVVVYEDEIVPLEKENVPFNSIPQLYIHAIVAGILKAAVVDAKALILSRKRTFSFANGDKPAEDPQLLQIIGEMASIAFVGEAAVLQTASAIDVAIEQAEFGEVSFEASHHASLLAAQTKVVLDDLALKATAKVFDVGGASATKQTLQLDRHWRNVRTLISHNPTVYKAKAIGNFVVNEQPLPLGEIYF